MKTALYLFLCRQFLLS